jgi:hypothetical protein
MMGFGPNGWVVVLGMTCLITVIVGPVLVMIVRGLVLERRGNEQRARLMATGIPAYARVVRLGPGRSEAAGNAGTMPLRVEVEITLPGAGGQPALHAAVIDQWIPRYAVASVQPGATLMVRVDRENPSIVAIDFASMGFA